MHGEALSDAVFRANEAAARHVSRPGHKQGLPPSRAFCMAKLTADLSEEG
jgi:hypothetical protein